MAENPTSDKAKKNQRWSHLLKEFPQVQSIAPQGVSPKRSPELANSVSVRPAQQSVALKENSTAAVVSTVLDVPATQPPETPQVGRDENILSVSQINRAIKERLEGEFQYLWLQGEISNFKAHTSGHFYFSVKDAKAQISAVMFRGFNSRLKFEPESGMEVLIRGKVTVYEPRGNYQLFCEHMEPVGAGALQKAFEQLKTKLQKEGLFAASTKKPLPDSPKRIGVVTSPTGAAIRDILNVLGRRSRRSEVVVLPARVQGDSAASEVVQRIQDANRLGDFDVLIVGRGGGSIEDLWGFNEEKVARAIAASEIPIISAVGHEIDFTIADFVADLRAPTPSAAAELVCQSEEQLVERLKFSQKALRGLMQQWFSDRRGTLAVLSKSLKDPRISLRDGAQRCDEWTSRLLQAMKNRLRYQHQNVRLYRQRLINPRQVLVGEKQKLSHLESRLRSGVEGHIERRRNHWQRASALLDSLSPLRVLDRGFAVLKKDSQIVRSVEGLKKGEVATVQLADGTVDVEVQKINRGDAKNEV